MLYVSYCNGLRIFCWYIFRSFDGDLVFFWVGCDGFYEWLFVEVWW